MPISLKSLAEGVLSNAIWWTFITLVVGFFAALWRLVRQRQRSAKLLEVLIPVRDPELDWVALESLFSAPSPDSPSDLTGLVAHLSDVTIVNHEDKPTEVRSLKVTAFSRWLRKEVKPIIVRSETPLGDLRRIEARGTKRFRLDYEATFKGKIRRDRVFLVLVATGHPERRTKLPDALFGLVPMVPESEPEAGS